MCSEIVTRISVKVLPNAGVNEVTAFADGVFRIKVRKPPEKDKANKELVSFLSKRLGLSKESITIIKGQTGRHKIVEIAGLNQNQIIDLLLSAK